MASSFDSIFLREGRAKTLMVHLAVFGKHPGWSDHMDDLGVATPSLAALKQVLYVEGIGGNIASGQWEKLARQGQEVPFGHDFLWARGEQIIAGRLEASSDSKGRGQFPLIVAAQANGFPLARAVPTLLAETNRLAKQCLATPEPAEVRRFHEQASARLPQELEQAGPGLSSAEKRGRFLDAPELGSEQVGLARILHVVMNGWPATMHLRCPRFAAGDLLAWLRFFQATLPAETAIFLAAKDAGRHLDVLIGSPSRQDFACLKASIEAAAITSEAPYNLVADFLAKAKDFLAAYREDERPKPFLAGQKSGWLRRLFG